MVTPAQITAAALALVDTPFHAQERVPGVGVDCIGVGVCVAWACRIPVQDRKAYPLRANGELQGELEKRLIRVHGPAQEGNLLMMLMPGQTQPHHVAIVVAGNRIVHAYAQVRKVVVQDYTEYWRLKVRGIYRFPGVE